MWDESTPFGARVAQRLADEQIIWLVTQGSDGTPQPSPVWFLWDGSTILIYSKADAPKLRNIGRSPRVALHFHTDAHGGNVVIFHGTASIEMDAPLASSIPAYVEKYRQGIANIGMAADLFAQAYSAAIRVQIEKVRGH